MALVHLLVMTGSQDAAIKAVRERFPGSDVRMLDRLELRQGGWRKQLHTLRGLRGEAIVFFFNSFADMREPRLFEWTGLIHRCRNTFLLDTSGNSRIVRRIDWFRLFPGAVASMAIDLIALGLSWVALKFLAPTSRPQKLRELASADLDLAFLYPYPLSPFSVGGASSHVEGFLTGLAENSAKVEIFTSSELPPCDFPVHRINTTRKLFVFRESLVLGFNWRFARTVRNYLARKNVRAFYQRHRPFVIAGALLSRQMGVPLILEYNGSEQWIAKHWDPSRFDAWLRLCEEISLGSATRVVVVSEALRHELLARGIPEERILVNPNGTDPKRFYPGCGRKPLREKLGFSASDIVVGFLGSFSFWHGISVLEQAILHLLTTAPNSNGAKRIRFILLGHGPLQAEMQIRLRALEVQGAVLFTGPVRHEEVPKYLDTTDILCSPHIPMPDGTPFFGSPTKLFEYMAAGKAIIASDLGQIGETLLHGETAVLVKPGDVEQLVAAIRRLAGDSELRTRLGANARREVIAKYTWKINAERVLRIISCYTKSTARGTGSLPKCRTPGFSGAIVESRQVES